MSYFIINHDLKTFAQQNIDPLVGQFERESIPSIRGDLLIRIDNEIKSASAIFSNAKEDIIQLEKLQRNLSGQLEQRAIQAVVVPSPIGISRGDKSWCWAISLLQFLANAPGIAALILAHPKCKLLAKLLESYYEAQLQEKPIADAIDPKALRDWIEDLGIDIRKQADPADALTKIFARIGFQYELKQEFHSVFDDGAEFIEKSSTSEKLPMIPLDLSGGLRKFKDLFLSSKMEDRRIKKLQFTKPPEDLVIHAQRIKQHGRNGTFQLSKIEDAIQIPQDFTLSNTQYEFTSCLIHRGDITGGHYIALINRPDGWYLIDDTKVHPLTTEEALAQIAKGDIFHYRKVQPAAQPSYRCGQWVMNIALSFFRKITGRSS